MENTTSLSVRQIPKNPIALRLYKVLGTNYDDAALRESLVSLTQFYKTRPSIPKRDGSHIALSEANVAYVRKNLGRDLQDRLETGSRKYLKAFEVVDQNLDALEKCINEMYAQCDEVETRLRTTAESCSSLLSRANGLRSERQVVEAKQKVAAAFLERFTLTEEENEALTLRETPIAETFFAALERTKQIKADCTLLLREGMEESKAGLDIMSMCTEQLDAGYQKLHRQTDDDLRRLGMESYPEVNQSLQKAIEHLRTRPELLEDLINNLAEIRQSTLMDAFVVALTRGGPGGVPRPIELHAHDPARYTGDMLAWVHQTVAWEHEFLESLFGIKQVQRMMGSVRNPTNDPDVAEKTAWIAQILDIAVQGLCKPLKYRVLQTIKSQEDSVITYKISNLLRFYLVTMNQTVGESAFLSKTLNELFEGSLQIFFDILDAQGRSSLRFLHPPEPNLSVPISVINAIQNLRELMIVYETSMLGDEADTQKVEDFRKILSACIDPSLEACHKMIELNSSKDTSKDDWTNHVFLLNCFSYIEESLVAFSFAIEKIEQLSELLRGHARHLTELHSHYLLIESGLHDLILAIEENGDKVPLSLTETGSQDSVTKALSKFANFLKGLDVISSPRLILLTAPRLPGAIHQGALRTLCLAYGTICEAIMATNNKYEFAGTLLGSHRPFGQLSTLRQILGISQES